VREKEGRGGEGRERGGREKEGGAWPFRIMKTDIQSRRAWLGQTYENLIDIIEPQVANPSSRFHRFPFCGCKEYI
jgi:hypothetical protein